MKLLYGRTQTAKQSGAAYETKPSLKGESIRGLSSHLPLSLHAAWRASRAVHEGLERSGDLRCHLPCSQSGAHASETSHAKALRQPSPHAHDRIARDRGPAQRQAEQSHAVSGGDDRKKRDRKKTTLTVRPEKSEMEKKLCLTNLQKRQEAAPCEFNGNCYV